MLVPMVVKASDQAPKLGDIAALEAFIADNIAGLEQGNYPNPHDSNRLIESMKRAV